MSADQRPGEQWDVSYGDEISDAARRVLDRCVQRSGKGGFIQGLSRSFSSIKNAQGLQYLLICQLRDTLI